MANSKAEKSMWTWEENKQFENCLAEFPEDLPRRWKIIASKLGTRSAAEVEQHHAALLDDVEAIEAGLIEPPMYDVFESPEAQKCRKTGTKETGFPRRGRPWTEDEHRLFLLGLEQYGKGDWKSISRYVVVSKTPTQVASHAQKYFERQEREERTKKRRSIFDNSIAGSSSLTKFIN